MAENYAFRMKDEALSHHGIEGQKWGVQNGPPYPLGSGQHSRAEVRAMRKESKKSYKELKQSRTKLTSVSDGPTIKKRLEEMKETIPEINEYISARKELLNYPRTEKGQKELESFAKKDFAEFGLDESRWEPFLEMYQNEPDFYWPVLYANNKSIKDSWDSLDKLRKELEPKYEKAAKEILGEYSDKMVLGRSAESILAESMKYYFS